LNALFVDNGIAPMSLNALVFVGFRGDEYPEVQARCKMMCEVAQAIGCPDAGDGAQPHRDALAVALVRMSRRST
jgi:hypothetical protein